jgi:hypothetical protein
LKLLGLELIDRTTVQSSPRLILAAYQLGAAWSLCSYFFHIGPKCNLTFGLSHFSIILIDSLRLQGKSQQAPESLACILEQMFVCIYSFKAAATAIT